MSEIIKCVASMRGQNGDANPCGAPAFGFLNEEPQCFFHLVQAVEKAQRPLPITMRSETMSSQTVQFFMPTGEPRV